ncbi:MAG: hypothetical protein ACYDC2_03225 [Solirubrobacteraceae bacterium]
MPIRPEERSRYPRDWPAISKAIRARAGGRCEWPRCGVPNGARICRRIDNLERWALAEEVDRYDAFEDYRDPIRVVLTVAHIDNTPEHCASSNLLALCQLHHLRLDAKHHAANARRTRERRSGQGRLFP